ncbi:ABC-2 type transport system ATP-binding protein [Clostridium sp. DSM 8431]|uniref:ABC transporter ATP-binding protein n=1 Tax=Clostridium sp. DSM 8431 TaxID=1761781 RepID=UPI0008E2A79A|nr:ABC transporter ATP-binding protein [Clostridium sp. DSM 8431]SFU75627.1 ABC-2 type transport system ATP-binding protein [Clostridium sp. DSM 8431]
MQIELKNIYKAFNKQVIFDNISYTFNSGKIYGIIGPNGIGKTTLFRCITGLLELDGGQIKINDKDVTISSRDEVVNNISYLLSNQVILHLSGFDNAKLFGNLYGIDNKRIEELFKEFDLFHAKDKKVKKYSLGMQQRLTLIVSLINYKRKIIILDEPYLGLDPIGIQCLNNKLLKLKENGYLIILSNHQLHESEKIFDEVIFFTSNGIISRNIKQQKEDLVTLFNQIYVKREDVKNE